MNGQPPLSTGAPVLGGVWPLVSDVPLETKSKAVDVAIGFNIAKLYK